jgi:hypothetical protein
MSLPHVPTLVSVVQRIVGKLSSGLLVSSLPISFLLPFMLEYSLISFNSAGISIAVGLVRICFPESKAFIEAKQSGKRTMTAGEFRRETVAMLGKEWRMCIYCIILMTWVRFDQILIELNIHLIGFK